jgi:hypothetical protein
MTNKERDDMLRFRHLQKILREAEKSYLKARIHMEMFLNKHPNAKINFGFDVEKIYLEQYGDKYDN